MKWLESERALSAIILLVMALFVASGTPAAGRWNRPLRLAALIGFGVALALALGETAFWWAGRQP